mgnify:CR=1 FL=1|jgi:hypothetical protein
MGLVRHYFRNRDRLSRPWVISVLSLYVLGNIILDVPRAFVLIWLRVNGKGRSILFASNKNQIDNVKKYSLELSNSCSVVKVKNWKSIYSIPQSILALNALYHISCSQQYNHRFLSKLDIHDAAYDNSSRYIGLILRFLRCRQVVLSREDIKPFSEVGVAAQDLGLLLIVIEHGIFTRSFESFPTTENTFHIFSSEENSRKRTPLAQKICKFNSPLFAIKNEFDACRLIRSSEKTQILIADTYNIRESLFSIAESVNRLGTVKIRLHPGINLQLDDYGSDANKIEMLVDAKLVITGISGFALEAAFCGIPTVILVNDDDAWAMDYLGIYDALSYVSVHKLSDFLEKNDDKLITSNVNPHHVKLFQEKMGYKGQLDIKQQITGLYIR